MKRVRVIHPFLFAVFPVLSLFSTHVDHVSLNEAYLPVAVMLVACGVLWLVLRVIVAQGHKRGLALSLFLLVFWAYGPAIDRARAAGVHRVAGGAYMLGVGALGVAFAVAWGVYALRRSPRTFETTTRFLNKVSACALLVVLGTLCFKASQAGLSSSQQRPVSPIAAQSEGGEPPPDIYYIILDAYARGDTLRNTFHYDNEPFLSFLRDRGFYVADKSYANYPWTLLSLSSSLNLDYLDAGAPENESQGDFDRRVQEQFRTNKAVSFLTARGYECSTFTSGYSGTDGMNVGVTLKPGLLLGEFQNILINMTPLRTALGRTEFISQYAMHRKRILYTLDRLPKMAHHGHPLFVFAHVTIPHPPFVLDADGNPVYTARPFILTDGTYFFESGGTEQEYRAGYTGQLAYVNARLMRIVDQIIEKSPDAVILLQGDHGSRLKNTRQLETTDLKEAMGILNAYRVPGRNAGKWFYDSISPVNSFRVVFNTYFGTSYPLLPDRSFSGEAASDFRLVEITQKLK